MKDSFVRTGDLFKTSGVERISPFRRPRRIHTLINWLVWTISLLCPMIYYLIKLLLSGKLVYIVIGASIIILCKYKSYSESSINYNFFLVVGLLYKMIGMSKISKGSSYGKTNTQKKTE